MAMMNMGVITPAATGHQLQTPHDVTSSLDQAPNVLHLVGADCFPELEGVDEHPDIHDESNRADSVESSTDACIIVVATSSRVVTVNTNSQGCQDHVQRSEDEEEAAHQSGPGKE